MKDGCYHFFKSPWWQNKSHSRESEKVDSKVDLGLPSTPLAKAITLRVHSFM